jgi:hypothetical protein
LGVELVVTDVLEGCVAVTEAEPVPFDVTVAVLPEPWFVVSLLSVLTPVDMPVIGFEGLLSLPKSWSYPHLPAKKIHTSKAMAIKNITKLSITAIGRLTESVTWIYCAGAVKPFLVRCQNRAIFYYS